MSYVIREAPLVISSATIRRGVLVLLRSAKPHNAIVYVGLIDDPIEDVSFDILMLHPEDARGFVEARHA